MIAEQENQEHKLALMKQEMEIIKRMSKIKHKIAVMSGKGGVGKSTVSVNIAAAFAKRVTNRYHGCRYSRPQCTQNVWN